MMWDPILVHSWEYKEDRTPQRMIKIGVWTLPYSGSDPAVLVSFWGGRRDRRPARAIKFVVWTLGGLSRSRSSVTWPNRCFCINWHGNNLGTYRTKPASLQPLHYCIMSSVRCRSNSRLQIWTCPGSGLLPLRVINRILMLLALRNVKMAFTHPF